MAPRYVGKELLYTTFRLDTYNDKIEYKGTCFVFEHTFKNKKISFLVTNRHVVEGMKFGTIRFPATTSSNQPDVKNWFDTVLPDLEKFWYFHPDKKIDVAVSPLNPLVTQCEQQGGHPFYYAIPNTIIPSDKKFDTLDAIEDVIFIGYPIGLRDEKNLIPIVRKGITATPINVDFEDKKQFLVDASVFPGSSGSPVFLYERELIRDKNVIENKKKLYFLGIISSGYLHHLVLLDIHKILNAFVHSFYSLSTPFDITTNQTKKTQIIWQN